MRPSLRINQSSELTREPVQIHSPPSSSVNTRSASFATPGLRQPFRRADACDGGAALRPFRDPTRSPTALRRLRLREHRDVALRRQRRHHRQRCIVQVHRSPTQPKHLTATHSRRRQQHPRRRQPIVGHELEERSARRVTTSGTRRDSAQADEQRRPALRATNPSRSASASARRSTVCAWRTVFADSEEIGHPASDERRLASRIDETVEGPIEWVGRRR